MNANKFPSLIFLFLLSFNFAFKLAHCQSIDNDLNDRNIKGKVSSTSESWYNYSSNKWTKGDFVTFNASGNIIRIEKYYNDEVSGYEEHYYDSKGNNSERKIYTDGNLTEHVYKIFDSLNNIAKRTTYDNQNKEIERIIFIRDKKGKLIECKYYESNSYVKSIIYSYNNKGVLLRYDYNYYDKSGLLYRSDSVKYLYDSEAKIKTISEYYYGKTKIVSNYIDGSLKNISETFPDKSFEKTYNTQGDIFTVKGHDVDYSYEYEYDSQGNWIKRNTIYTRNGIKEGYYTRSITYY